MIKNIIIAGAILITLVAGVVFPIGGSTIVEKIGSSVSFATDNVTNFGGVNVYSYSIPLPASAGVGSTTLATIKSPAGTSTLVFAACNPGNSTSSASVVTLGKGTFVSATTTSLFSVNVAANDKWSLVAGFASSTAFILAPNTFVNVTQAGGSGNLFYPGGTCEFRIIANGRV